MVRGNEDPSRGQDGICSLYPPASNTLYGVVFAGSNSELKLNETVLMLYMRGDYRPNMSEFMLVILQQISMTNISLRPACDCFCCRRRVSGFWLAKRFGRWTM